MTQKSGNQPGQSDLANRNENDVTVPVPSSPNT
jgi:hypothetical protein